MPNYLDYQTNWPFINNKARIEYQRMVREYPKLYPERYKNAEDMDINAISMEMSTLYGI